MRVFDPDAAERLTFVESAGYLSGYEVFYTTIDVHDGVDRRRLWLLNLADGVSGALDTLGESPREPATSPDGSQLAFLADTEYGTQVCCIDTASRSARVLTTASHGVSGRIAWAPDGRRIAFTAKSAPPRQQTDPYRITRATYRHEWIGLIDDAVTVVHVLDIRSGTSTPLLSRDAIIGVLDWSPDGSRLLAAVSFLPGRAWNGQAELRAIDVETGRTQTVLSAWGAIDDAVFSAEADCIVVAGTPAIDGQTQVSRRGDLWSLVPGEPPSCLTGDLSAGVGVWLEFDHPTWGSHYGTRIRLAPGGNTAWCSAQVGGDVGICGVDLANPGETTLELDVHRVLIVADVGPAGELLYVGSSISEPPELFTRADGHERQLTENSTAVAELTGAQSVHRFTVACPGERDLDAWAISPAGNGPHPSVLCIHGGPNDASGNVFVLDHQLLVAAGFAVVFSNFRGSGGYGDCFHQALHGGWGELGEQDHHATIDRAIELGIADPDRLGVYGLSYGGYATCWLLGRSGRFKAGVAENPVSDWSSMFGTTDAPDVWLTGELGGTPEENPQRYKSGSPLTYASGCTAPLLFIVGEDDYRCRPEQSEQYFRVLAARGGTTEMLRLPGSGHTGTWDGPVAARRAQNEALIEWFTRFLK